MKPRDSLTKWGVSDAQIILSAVWKFVSWRSQIPGDKRGNRTNNLNKATIIFKQVKKENILLLLQTWHFV